MIYQPKDGYEIEGFGGITGGGTGCIEGWGGGVVGEKRVGI